MLEQIEAGRTDLVFEYLAAGNPVTADLLAWCAYYGDVSAIKCLLGHGASLDALGDNLDLNGACFHGHWRLVQFLIERGANVDHPLPDTGEVPLHATLCSTNRLGRNAAIKVLLSHGANPNLATKPGVETGSFMRDCRTKGETPLHRAAAFGDDEAIRLLLNAGAVIEAKDVNGETPLSWGSWHARPAPILRLLCYGRFRIHPDNRPMDTNLVGDPD